MKISIRHKSAKSYMGRFGGGWNWNLGFQAGGHELILNLLVFSIRFDFENEKATKDTH